MKNFMFAAKDTPTCMRKTEAANPIGSKFETFAYLLIVFFIKNDKQFGKDQGALIAGFQFKTYLRNCILTFYNSYIINYENTVDSLYLGVARDQGNKST